MHRNAIRIEVRCRHGEQNAFLLHSCQDIFRQQNPTHCFQLRFQQVGPQSLSAEKVWYESVTLLKKGKGCERTRTQVRSRQVRTFSVRHLMSVGQQAMENCAAVRISSVRSESSQFEIWLRTQTHG